jgi:hypothetical protein
MTQTKSATDAIRTGRTAMRALAVGAFALGAGAIGAIALGTMAIGRTNRLSLKYQRPADERAKPFCLVRPESRRLDSMKTPTLFAGMGSANKYPWTDPQPADANSLR